MEETKTSANADNSTTNLTTIAVAHGDGIGPEIMDAALRVLKAANAPLEYVPIKIGKEVFLDGYKSGISPEAWDVIRKYKVFLKAPITTPQGGGYKSLNVTIRKSLSLYANVRPCIAYTPYVHSNFPDMDLVIVRENEEDLYAGIEHQQTPEVVQCLKLITRPGSEKIIRYAFEYARAYDRKKVTCMSKDNIMKFTDGLFHDIFDEVAKEYPDIENEHYIIDIGSAMLADDPERFDVVVTSNLYGDIVSDITAQVAGSVGLGGSANIGNGFGMFEAIHGSAPDIAGQGIANPTGLINASCMMLLHLGYADVANKINKAVLRTIEDGIHTGDIYDEKLSKKKVGTKEFTDAVIERLGQAPQKLKALNVSNDIKPITIELAKRERGTKDLVGVDVFIDWDEADRNPDVIGDALVKIAGPDLKLKMITNRGVKVYPNGLPETFWTDHWRCRFISATDEEVISHKQIIGLLGRLDEADFDAIKTENLYIIDGKRGYSLGQGE